MRGRRIGRFQIERALGAGGMGTVYAARDVVLDRLVALKLLPAALEGDAERRLWLLREARSAAAISHPNVATVFEAGEDAGTVYVATELVEGDTLAAHLAAGPLDLGALLSVATGIARGLEAAHAARVVHRDLKPANVMLGPSGAPKLVDFGLARPPARPGVEERLSFGGVVAGTPGYMAPEQIAGTETDARTDLFALGAVIFEAWTGAPPFGSAGLAAMSATMSDEPPALDAARPGAPSALVALVRALLEKTRDRRPPSAKAVREALEGLAAGMAEAAAPTLRPPRAEARVEMGATFVAPSTSSPGRPGPPAPALASQLGLVGREEDLVRIEDALRRFARIVTVTGPPGIGKTAAAAEAAARARAGGARTTSIVLGGIGASAEAEAAIAIALRRGTTGTLDELLAAEDGLVHLDGGEALGRALAALAARWLALSPRVRLVVSSRAELGLPDEVVLPLGPLAPAAAREVFLARARRARPTLRLDAEQEDAIAAIGRALDHNPLALGLAAARVAVLSPKEIAARLGGDEAARMALLAERGPRSSTSLRETIAWSFELLEPDARTVAGRLALFEDGFDAASAEEVAAEPGRLPVLDAIEALRSASLLRAETGDGDEVRLAMDANVRAFARAAVKDEPADAAVRAAFVRRMGAVAAAALAPSGRDAHVAAAHGRSLRAAVRLAAAIPAAIVPAAWAAVLLARHRSDAEVEAALEAWARDERATGAMPEALVVHAGLARAARAAERDLEGAMTLARAAAAQAERVPDLLPEARGTLFDVLLRGARLDEADAVARAMLAAAASPAAEIDAQQRLATVAWRRSRGGEALGALRRALGLAEGLRDRRRQADVLLTLGILCVQETRFGEARGLYERARALAEAEHLEGMVAVLDNNLGVVHHEEGRLEEARSAFEAAHARARSAGRALLGAVARGNAGMVEHEAGRRAEAARQLSESVALLGALREARYRAALLGAHAAVLAELGRFPEAHAALVEAAALLPRAHEPQLALALSIRAAHVELAEADNPPAAGPRAAAARATALAHLAERDRPDGVAARSDLARMALRALAARVGRDATG